MGIFSSFFIYKGKRVVKVAYYGQLIVEGPNMKTLEERL